jgi:hypothetical protein
MKKVTLFILALGLTFGVMAQNTITRGTMKQNPFMVPAGTLMAKSPSKVVVKDGFSMSASNIVEQDDSFHATISINPGDCAKYYLTVYTANTIENFTDTSTTYSTVAEYLEYEVEYYLSMYQQYGLTAEQAEQYVYMYGEDGTPMSGDLEYYGFAGNAEYELYAYVVDAEGNATVETYTFSTPSSEISGTPVINSITANCDADAGTIEWALDMENVKYFYFHAISIDTLDAYYGSYVGQYSYDQLAISDMSYYMNYGYSSYFKYLNVDSLNTYCSATNSMGDEWVEGDDYIAVAYGYNGNGESSEDYAYVEFTFGGVGLEDAMEVMVSVYPNPTSDYLTVNSDKIQKVELYNELGQVVLTSNQRGAQTISLANLSKGTYVVKAYADGAVATSKVVVR